MAKRRVQVADLDTSVATSVKPVASVVDTYVRPPSELKTASPLENFVDAISPFIESKVREEQAYNEKLANDVVSGVIEKQAFQAKNAVRDLTLLGQQDYDKHSDDYVKMTKEEVASHRQANYLNYYKDLQKGGVNSVVINLIKKDMEAVDYEFFSKVFLPAKFDYDVTTAITNDLAPQLEALAEMPTKTSLKEGTNVINTFMELYPDIPKGKINDYVIAQELSWAGSTDENGVIRGKSWRSEWLVENDIHLVKRNIKTWEAIEQAEANKQLAVKQATVKRQDAFISAGITSQTDMLTALWKGNKPSYLADFSQWTDEVQNKRNEFQQSLEKQFGKGSPLVAQGLIDYDISIQSLTTKEVLPEIMKQGRTDTLNTNMTNVLNRGLLNTVIPEEERIATGIAMLDDMVANSGLTESEVEEEAFRQQIELTELYGTNTPFYEWLKKNGSLNKSQYTDETQRIFDELEKYNKQFEEQNLQANKNAFLAERLTKFKTIRDSSLLSNLEYTDEATGKTVKISEDEIQAAYEQEAANELSLQLARIDKEYDEVLDVVGDIPEGLEEDVDNKRQVAKAEAVANHADRKIKDFYLPRRVLPVEVQRVLTNTVVTQALTSTAGEELDEDDLQLVDKALTMYETMNDYSAGYTDVAFSEDSDMNVRLRHLSTLVRDMDMPLAKAVKLIQKPLYPSKGVSITDEEITEAVTLERTLLPNQTAFEDVLNSPDLRLYFEALLKTEIEVFGKTKKQALPSVIKYAVNDFLISEGYNGTKTAILKRNTDQQRLAANPARMKQLVTAIHDIQGFPDYMVDIAGEDADLVILGHPTNANMAQVVITNENAERNPILNLSYNDLLTLPLETVKARILSETQDKISYAAGVTSEEKLLLQQLGAIAAGQGAFVDTTSTEALARFQKAKEEQEAKRIENEAQAIADREAYLASLPPEASAVREDIQIPVVREALEAVGVTNFIDVTKFIEEKVSSERFDELVSSQRKTLTDKKAITKATKALKQLDPSVAKELGLEKAGLYSKKLTERGITINEQGEIAHAVLALLQIVKENQ